MSDVEATSTPIETIEREELPKLAKSLCEQGYRLVQMMGTPRADCIDVMISFDKQYEIKHLKVEVPRSDLTLPSISEHTLAAFSYENELQDLFGIKVEGLLVNYEGNFLRTKVEHPLSAMVDPSVGKKKPKTTTSVPIKAVSCESTECPTEPPKKDEAKPAEPEKPSTEEKKDDSSSPS